MERRIDDAQILLTLDDFGVDRNGMYLLQVCFVHILADNLDKFLIAVEFDVGHLHLVHLIDNSGIVRSQHLCTVVPISFIAVIFTWIMASRDIDAALATQMTNSEGHFRRRTQIVEQIDLNTVSRENVG